MNKHKVYVKKTALQIRSVRAQPDEWDTAQQGAAAEGISMSELVRRLIVRYNEERLAG